MKTLILTAMLALTAGAGLVVTTNPADAGGLGGGVVERRGR